MNNIPRNVIFTHNIIVFNIDIYQFIYKILSRLNEMKKIKNKNIVNILKHLFVFFRRYNNNYRPIYHVELFLLNVFNEINN